MGLESNSVGFPHHRSTHYLEPHSNQHGIPQGLGGGWGTTTKGLHRSEHPPPQEQRAHTRSPHSTWSRALAPFLPFLQAGPTFSPPRIREELHEGCTKDDEPQVLTQRRRNNGE